LEEIAAQMQSVLLVLCFAAFIAVQPGTAQETIFNVPSGDILHKWKVYGEFDFAYLWDASSGTYTPRLVAGLGHKIEIGINLNGITSPGPSQTTPTPTLKWKAYDGGRNGWGFIIGVEWARLCDDGQGLAQWKHQPYKRSKWKDEKRAKACSS
jgi:hypothetical protein